MIIKLTLVQFEQELNYNSEINEKKKETYLEVPGSG